MIALSTSFKVQPYIGRDVIQPILQFTFPTILLQRAAGNKLLLILLPQPQVCYRFLVLAPSRCKDPLFLSAPRQPKEYLKLPSLKELQCL